MAEKFERQSGARIFCAADARRLSRRRLPRMAFDFIDGATGREVAAARNEAAFDSIELQPRVLAPAAERSLRTEILGQTFARPFGIAPMGMCNFVWPGADAMIGRASRRFDLPVCLSSAASSTMEEMRSWADKNAWFQLYVNGPTEAALEMARRAERAGYTTLILTVDVPQVSRRLRDLRNGFSVPFKFGPRQVLDFALHPRWSLATLWHGTPSPRNFPTSNGVASFDREASRAGADWGFLDRLRALWRGNLIIKGVTAPSDAIRIRDAGADAIWVSNHGGRQLDAAPLAIDALVRVRGAVGSGFPLIFDGGVRHGEDVLRALARGADFVMLGRTILFAIGADGERGLTTFLQGVSDDLDIAMAQIGLAAIDEISEAILVENNVDVDTSLKAGLRLARSK